MQLMIRSHVPGVGLSQRGGNKLCAKHTQALLEANRAQWRALTAQQRVLRSVPAAQPKLAESSAAHSSAEYDPLRDGPLRFLGYSNEVGEAFGMLIPPQMVAATYAVAISYVLVDTVDKFARARSGARDTLAAAASVGDNANAAALQAAATAAALKQADPAGPPHKARAHATSSTDASLNSQAAFAAAAASSSSSSSNSGNAGNAIETGPATATQPSPAGDMFTETLPFAGAVAGAGGRVWDSGYGGGNGSGSNGASNQINGPSSLDKGLDNAAGIIDAVGVVSGTGGGAGNLGSAGGNAGVGGGSVTGPGRAQLTREEENAALVVGGLKALDTVIWQMLASVMIPGFIIHQSVRVATQSLSSPAGMNTLNLGAATLGRMLGVDLTSTLPGYVISALPVALGLALVPIICHPIDSVVDKLLDSTLRPVLRKYRLQLQQQQQEQRQAP